MLRGVMLLLLLVTRETSWMILLTGLLSWNRSRTLVDQTRLVFLALGWGRIDIAPSPCWWKQSDRDVSRTDVADTRDRFQTSKPPTANCHLFLYLDNVVLLYNNGPRGSFLVNAQSCKNTSVWATSGYTIRFPISFLHKLRATEGTT